jgi:hypothetical protein
MDKRESFYAYSVESLSLDATESKIFLSATSTVGEQFSSADLESIMTYCEKSKKGGWEADSVVEDISEEKLIEFNEDELHHHTLLGFIRALFALVPLFPHKHHAVS